MNLLYCGDRNIEKGLVLSVMSVMEHNSCPMNVYVITMSFSDGKKEYEPVAQETSERLRSYMQSKDPANTLTVIDTGDMFRRDLPKENVSSYFTPYCMLRLYADSIQEIPDRILYLDTDVLCRGDLSGLYGTDIEGAEYAGVLDHYGSWFFRRRPFRRDYVNSGVLLLNMGLIRRSGLFRRCRDMCREKKMFMPDQSAINKLTAVKVLLPRKFNEQRRLQSDTVLQHFTTSFRLFPVPRKVTVKPWEFGRVRSVLGIREYDALFDRYTEEFEQ